MYVLDSGADHHFPHSASSIEMVIDMSLAISVFILTFMLIYIQYFVKISVKGTAENGLQFLARSHPVNKSVNAKRKRQCPRYKC